MEVGEVIQMKKEEARLEHQPWRGREVNRFNNYSPGR